MTYEREKSMYELIQWCKKDYQNKKAFDDSKCVQYVKRQVRQLAKENHKDSISKPLTEEKRFIHHGECGEYWSEYYIIPCQATEQEIQQYIDE